MDQFEFIRRFCLRPQSFAWFLGAGASRNAGLPTANDIIDDLKRRYYCSEENQKYSSKDMQNAAVRAEVEAFMIARGFPKPWAADEYSTYFDRIFGEDRKRQRAYLQGILSEDRVSLAVGNRVFGALLVANYCRAAFTTNFDTVVEKAVAEVGGRSLSAYHLEGAENANEALNNEEFPFYCKLHGDFRYERLMNLLEDLVEQNAALSKALVNAANRFGFVVVGYSGRDKSVMELFHTALESQNPFPHGLYWIGMKGNSPPPLVGDLLTSARGRGVDAAFVEIETFDSLLLRLWRNLSDIPEGLDAKVRKGRAEVVSIPVPQPGRKKPLIRINALPVLEAPNECMALRFKRPKTWVDLELLLRDEETDLIVTVDDMPWCWGPIEEVQRVFERDLDGIDTIPIPSDWGVTGRLHIKRFLEDALMLAFVRTRPLLKRRRRSTGYLIVDSNSSDVGVFDGLFQVVGKTFGTIPGLALPETEHHPEANKVQWAEAVRLSLTMANNRLWLQLDPDVWIWPKFARADARDWLDERKIDRRNDKYDALLSAWCGLLIDTEERGAEVKLSAYDDESSASNPTFVLSSRTGYAMKGRL